MKKLLLVLSAASILSVSAFANNSTYKSTSETMTHPSSSSTIKEEQQRMEDGSRTKVKETTTTTRPNAPMNKKKVESKKTEYKSDGMAD